MPVLEFRLYRDGRTRWFVLQTRTECDEARPAHQRQRRVPRHQRPHRMRLAVDQLEERLATLQDNERRRIAQELHNSTAQHLVGAKLLLLNLRKQVPAEPGTGRRGIALVARGHRRDTHIHLSAASLAADEEGLERDVRRYVPGFERRTGLRTSLRVTAQADELPAELQHAMLRMIQESLGNVQRHAGATRASVDLRCIGGLGAPRGARQRQGHRARGGPAARRTPAPRTRHPRHDRACPVDALPKLRRLPRRGNRDPRLGPAPGTDPRNRAASPTSPARRWARGAAEGA